MIPITVRLCGVSLSRAFVNTKGRVTNPSYFYKILLRHEGDSPKTIAFLLPQLDAVGSFDQYQVQVNTVESLTGIDFFPVLHSHNENRVEAQTGRANWGLN